MPVFFDSDPHAEAANHTDGCITIGLVNNMGDEALKPTERQFISLLNAASDGMLIRLSLYTLPGIARSAAVGRHVRNLYSPVDDLWESQLDGLIVTGREPLAARLEDEPIGTVSRGCWAGLSRMHTQRYGPAWRRTRLFSIWTALSGSGATTSCSAFSDQRASRRMRSRRTRRPICKCRIPAGTAFRKICCSTAGTRC